MAESGTVRIIAADREGERLDTYYDSDNNRAALGEILERCPWHP